ncbi:hypothetical protein IC620_07275 [Hazenella sp. IB182357]|uniref:Uncharacterized protein n=1 Tax=Polycladospora coralii TaxID=2771432 RepID=A0A926N9Z5_9BACL|nr:hypothetical protein [Polycladospora coralii]MBD1372162.1 hypothetical protein [Polycladospora coralii]
MDTIFIKWIETQSKEFFNPEVDIYEVTRPDAGMENSRASITNHTDSMIGEVIVWRNGILELQVQSMNHSESMLFEYHELDDTVCFNDILKNYREALVSGSLKFTTLRKLNYDPSNI